MLGRFPYPPYRLAVPQGNTFLDERFYRGTFDSKGAAGIQHVSTRFTDVSDLAHEAVQSICGMLHVKGAALYLVEKTVSACGLIATWRRRRCPQPLPAMPASSKI